MSLRACLDLPRDLTEDLVIPTDEYLEPYSMEAIEVPLTTAHHLREVLLAVAAGDIDYEPPEIVKALAGLEETCPDEAAVILYTLETEHPSEIEDLPQLLDELVEAVRSST